MKHSCQRKDYIYSSKKTVKSIENKVQNSSPPPRQLKQGNTTVKHISASHIKCYQQDWNQGEKTSTTESLHGRASFKRAKRQVLPLNPAVFLPNKAFSTRKGLVLNSINRLSENAVRENASTDGCLRKRKKKNINNQHFHVHIRASVLKPHVRRVEKPTWIYFWAVIKNNLPYISIFVS